MLRGLLLLLIVATVFAVVWSLMRRFLRRRDPPVQEPVETEGPALPAPEAPEAKPADGAEPFHRLYELAFGVALSAQPATQEHRDVAAAVIASLDSVATEPRYAPRRPLLLPQILRAVNDDEISRRELASMIARDPALTGRLLELANSSYYRIHAQPVESIDRAVAILGTDGIRSLIAKAIMQPVFRVAGGEFVRFPEIAWEHTFRSATAAEAHAAIVENADPFAAQLLALIMGLATIIVFRVTMDEYAARPGLRPDAATIASLLDAHAAPLARRIAENWDLSGRILAALEDQAPAIPMQEPTALGRSLRFGRLAGALAVLHANSLIDDAAAMAAMAAIGAEGPSFERIWLRLTGQQPKTQRSYRA